MKALKQSQGKSSTFWLVLLVGALLLTAVLSFSYEVDHAQTAVTQYVGIWEEDIAKSLLLQQDPHLLEKIMGQLKEVHSSVAQISLDAHQKSLCLLHSQIPITLFSTPAGRVQVCYSSSDLLWRSLASPIFMLGLFFALGFVFLGSRRDLLNRLKEQQLQGELALNKEISEMSRQVAHDIRSPLTALRTLSQFSHDMTSDKADLLKHAVQRIQGIAEDLLSRSQKEIKAAANIKTDEVSLPSLCHDLLKEYEFSHPKVRFTWENHLTLSAALPIEKNKLQRMLSNLLNNAIEASPEEGALIHVSLFTREQHWVLQITDHGCGIPDEILPQLMQSGASFGKAQGHGLGLHDAFKTLQALGGELQIRSRLGVGTQVVMLFPKTSWAQSS